MTSLFSAPFNMTDGALRSQNNVLTEHLRRLLNISVWLSKSACLTPNQRCLKFNVLEKRRRQNPCEAFQWEFGIKTSFEKTSGNVLSFLWWLSFWLSFFQDLRLSGVVTVATRGPDSLGVTNLSSCFPVSCPADRTVQTSLLLILASGPDWDLYKQRPLCGCRVFDPHALISERFFGVVLLT